MSGFGGFLWLISCVILFLGSGYGFLTSSMLFFEGPVVARDDIAAATQKIAKLEQIAKTNLPVPEYERLKTQVEQLRGSLHAEILNISSGYCGVGKRATQIINDLNGLLSNIRVISGTDKDHSCDNRERLDRMVALYDKSINDGLANAPLITKYNTPGRKEAVDTLIPVLDHELSALREVQVELAGIPSFLSNIGLYHKTVEALEAASLTYAKAYEQVSRFLNLSAIHLPSTLETTDLEQIVSGIQVLNTLMSRGDRLTTWLYVLVAFGCDIMAAFAASTVFLEYQSAHRETSVHNLDGPAVRYLWVPEPPPTGSGNGSDRDRPIRS